MVQQQFETVFAHFYKSFI